MLPTSAISAPRTEVGDVIGAVVLVSQVGNGPASGQALPKQDLSAGVADDGAHVGVGRWEVDVDVTGEGDAAGGVGGAHRGSEHSGMQQGLGEDHGS